MNAPGWFERLLEMAADNIVDRMDIEGVNMFAEYWNRLWEHKLPKWVLAPNEEFVDVLMKNPVAWETAVREWWNALPNEEKVNTGVFRRVRESIAF